MTGDAQPRTPWEVVAVWALLVVDLVAVVITYTRLEPDQLYHVSGSGVLGGLSRGVVLLNYPFSLIAIALALVALDALPRRAWVAGGPAIVACAVTLWPGVVEQAHLTAKWVNAIPALGVGIVLALTIAARAGPRIPPVRLCFDPVRIGVALVVAAISIPWFLAEIGLSLPDGVFLMRRLGREADGTILPAVHLGHHHGFDGVMVLLTALALSRLGLRSARLSAALRTYMGFGLAYGSVNLAQDAWNEQFVKRGWLDWKIPSAVVPSLSAVWLVILLLTIAFTAAFGYEAKRARGPS